jgi:hypothetical protein
MPPFRSDLDALEARHAILEAEVADKVRARDEAARMLDEARARQRDEATTARHIPRAHALSRRRVIFAMVGTMMFALGLVLVARVDDQREERARGFRATRIMVELEAFTKQVCACRDVECTLQVNETMRAWRTERAIDRDIDGSDPRRAKKLLELGERMATCAGKLAATHARPAVLER